MTGSTRNLSSGEVTDTIQRVLAGDVNAYDLIYQTCDRPLRAFIGRRYSWAGPDFIEEVAVRTHEYALSRLAEFDPAKGASFLTWFCWQSLSVADQVKVEWFGLRRVIDKKGKRRDVPRFVVFDEEVHAQYVPTQPGPKEAHDRQERDRALRQELKALAEQGRLSIACHDLAGRTFAATARRLGITASKVWRERERARAVLKRRLQERGIRPFETDSQSGAVINGQSYGDEDDWCVSVMARLPDGPDTLVGAEAKDEMEEEPDE
jgi:RNA polymerase sigma factor (sigma-70 family)